MMDLRRSMYALTFLFAGVSAFAQPTYPTMAPIEQYRLASKADEIALARSAAPPSISDNAEILTLGTRGYDTAERGTRVLQLLDELGTGEVRPDDLPLGETLPTPVARVRHGEDATDEPPSAVIPPKPRRRRMRGGAKPTKR